MKIKKLVCIVTGLLMALSITACSGSSSATTATAAPTAAPETGQQVETENATQGTATEETTPAYEPEVKEIVFGIPADPQYWNPLGQFNMGRRNVIPLIYQTLVAPVPDPVNGGTTLCFVIAESFEKKSDTEYEIKIRDGIYDTAGNTLDANDVVYVYEKALAQGNFATLNNIETIKALDDLTVAITVKNVLAVGDFQDIMTTIPMFTQEADEASPDGMTTTPIGTTGYVLAEYNAGSNAVFEKADSYWNDAANESKSYEDGYCPWWDCTKLDRIVVEFINDDSTRAISLEKGEIDVAAQITTTDATVFSTSGTVSIGHRPSNLFGLAFNASDKSVTNNYNLRMALSLCVDAQGVLDLAFDGEGDVLKAWAYPTYYDYQANWDSDPYFEYDIDKAKEYLDKYFKETNTKASDLNLVFVAQSGTAQGKIVEAVQSYIVDLVGNANCVSIESYDTATYDQYILDPNNFDILLMSSQAITRTYCTVNWSRQADASILQSGNDIFHSGDEELQTILHKAIDEDTHNDENIAAFQDYINEKAYLKMLVCNDEFVAGQGWISGLDNCIGYKNAVAILALDYDWAASGK